MEDFEEYLLSAELSLDRELEDVSQSMRQHHSDWDNHIITLSTLSLGFIFTFLPLANGNNAFVITLGSICFVASIMSATSNYIFADKGFEISLNSMKARRRINQKTKNRYKKLKSELQKLQAENKQELYDNAKKQCKKDFDIIFDKSSIDEMLESMKSNNSKITKLNYAKTFFFLVGISLTVNYSLVNFELLANKTHNKALKQGASHGTAEKRAAP